jgi:hypothetical protein
VRRSELKAAAADAAVELEAAELFAALARAAGARLDAAALADAGAVLFATWRGTDVWDEAREDPDVHRAGDGIASLATPTRALREILLDLLEAMPRERFAPVDELARASVKDLRASGAARLLERAQRRADGRVLGSAPEVSRRILIESLPRLGAADRASIEGRDVVRLSARARIWLEHVGLEREARPASEDRARWEGGARLVAGGTTRVRALLAAAEGAEVIASSGTLTLRVDARSVASALARGVSADVLRARLEELAAPLDAAAERALLRGVEASRPRLAIVAVSAFIPIDDAALRERLLALPALRAMLVDRSPAEGLLVREGVLRADLERALASLGVALDDAMS